MEIKLNFHNLKTFAGCFWQNGSQWEGVLNGSIEAGEIKIIRSQNIILLLQKDLLTGPVQSSSENNPESR